MFVEKNDSWGSSEETENWSFRTNRRGSFILLHRVLLKGNLLRNVSEEIPTTRILWLLDSIQPTGKISRASVKTAVIRVLVPPL